MAWFRPMGVDSVDYHRETVAERGDDHPGRALAYYGSRGETPLRWGGSLADRLGLSGEVTPEEYEAVFGPGGFRHPRTGEQLVSTTRPGFELVIGAHKSVTVLGVLGHADDMHAILDAETAGTMGWLDQYMQERGGTRGRAAVRAPTQGLAYAVTRHGTSRDGDPHPHDHILIPNVTEMLDDKGGFKALHSATLRDKIEAATIVGRLYGAAKAIELGYEVAIDNGDSGRARRWRIVGVRDEVCELYSKRSDEIADYLDERGYSGYRARNIAARATRKVKRHTGVDELMGRWHNELGTIDTTVEGEDALLADVRARTTSQFLPGWSDRKIDTVAAELMDPAGEMMRRTKTFDRSRLIAEVGWRLYRQHPAELDRVIDRIIASPLVVPLIGNSPALPEQVYASARVLANQQSIADTVERLINRPDPTLDARAVLSAVHAKAAGIRQPLTAGQTAAVEAVCRSGRAVDVIVGIAGSGKTTALDAATTALEDAGYQVIGTATSGQAARTLGREARIDESRTMRSLLWRLDHRQITLDDRTVVILDEAGMTADVDLARLLLAAERTGAKVVLVGDHRQLSAVGPGGAMAAMLARHPEAVTALMENLRQRDPAERAALDHLRHGSLHRAISFYANTDRIHTAPSRVEALDQMVTAWEADTAAGHDTIMVAHKRDSVAALNRIARAHAQTAGRLTGPHLAAPGGRHYATGDPVVLLAPNHEHDLVTSQRGTIAATHPDTGSLTLLTDDGRYVTLTAEAIDADHLDHGYAITVHREQGATCDRTYYLADGGGRELAYVALSRARDRSEIHAVADDLDQALDDLGYDWSRQQHQQWITTHHRPGLDARVEPLPVADRATRIRQLRREIEHLQVARPPDVTREIAATRHELDRLRHDKADLLAGQGRWRGTPEGAAAIQLRNAEADVDIARTHRTHARGLLNRRDAKRHLANAHNHHAHALHHWQQTGGPVADKLDRQIAMLRERLGQLHQDDRFNRQWRAQHPEIDHAIADRTRQLHQLEGIPSADVTPVGPRVERPTPQPRPPDRGIDAIGL